MEHETEVSKPASVLPFSSAFNWSVFFFRNNCLHGLTFSYSTSDFDPAESTDLKLKCGSEVFNVHKKVLCGQSKFFANACKDGFKEASSGVIDLSEDDPIAIKAMLQYCYTADYAHGTALHAGVSDHKTQSRNSISNLILPQVYALAEKYGIRYLKELACSNFKQAADTDWESPFYPATISAVYTSTLPGDRSLRDITVANSKIHIDSLLKNPEFETMMEENGEFGKDLVKAMGSKSTAEAQCATYGCGSCGKAMTARLEGVQQIFCLFCGQDYTYKQWVRRKQ